MTTPPEYPTTWQKKVIWRAVSALSIAVIFAVSSIGTGMAGSFDQFVIWRMLGGVAIAATGGQLLLTRAYASAPAAFIGPFTYTSVIFAGALPAGSEVAIGDFKARVTTLTDFLADFPELETNEDAGALLQRLVTKPLLINRLTIARVLEQLIYLPTLSVEDFGRNDALTAWAADAAQPSVLRLSALAQLPPAQALGFATHDLPELRAAAARQAAAAFPDKAAGLAADLIQRASATDLLAAYHILGAVATPASAALLAAELDRLSAGNVPEALRLDLLEAASLRPEPELKAKLAGYEASLAKDGHSIYDLTLQGGDPARGREVFANQGTCLKCHRAEGEGGSAGPRLTGLALVSQPAQMLDSVLYPNNIVVPGFGISVVTLQDGAVLVGTVMAESAESLTLRTAEGESKAVAKSSIKEQLPPVSPMPPVGLSLTKRDLRDLMAFLRGLTTPLPVLK